MMPTIMFNIEANLRHCQTKEKGQGDSLPPRGCCENQQDVQTAKGRQDDPRLEIHLRAVALSPAGAAKKFVYSSSQLDLKTVIPVKSQSGIRHWIYLAAQTHIPSASHIIRRAQWWHCRRDAAKKNPRRFRSGNFPEALLWTLKGFNNDSSAQTCKTTITVVRMSGLDG